MLPVSGAAQLVTSGAISMLQPVSSASGAYSRFVRPETRRQEQVPQAALLGQRLELLDHRRDRVVVGARRTPVLVVGGLGGEDEFRHEGRKAFVVILSLCRHREVHVATLNGAENGVMTESRPPFPPFTPETARQKVQAAEDAWNTRDPERVSLAYTPGSQWRNRDRHVVGREQIVLFLTQKWQRELDYALRKSLWDFHDNRIAVRFQYECRDATGQWYRSYGNELWEFAPDGLMARREASINDVAIGESERRYFGPRPESEHGLEIPLW